MRLALLDLLRLESILQATLQSSPLRSPRRRARLPRAPPDGHQPRQAPGIVSRAPALQNPSELTGSSESCCGCARRVCASRLKLRWEAATEFARKKPVSA